jgi:hypothetical protein
MAPVRVTFQRTIRLFPTEKASLRSRPGSPQKNSSGHQGRPPFQAALSGHPSLSPSSIYQVISMDLNGNLELRLPQWCVFFRNF